MRIPLLLMILAAPLALAAAGPYVETGILGTGLPGHFDLSYHMDLVEGERVTIDLTFDDPFAMPEVHLAPPSDLLPPCANQECATLAVLLPRTDCERFVADHSPLHPLGEWHGAYVAPESGQYSFQIGATSRGTVAYRLTVAVGEDGGSDRVQPYIFRGQHIPYAGPYGFCDLT